MKRGISLDKLKAGEYTLKEIVYVKPSKEVSKGRVLGKIKGKEVVLKKGPYGLYVQCNGKNKTCKYLRKDEDEITLADATKLFNR